MSEKKDKLLASLEAKLPPDVVQSTNNPIAKKDDVDSDYEFSREHYRELVDNSKQAIEMMMQLASESEHPRAFEVLGNMLKQSADMTDKLMELQKRKKDVKQETSEEKNKGVTNNNLFVGSTTDLQRFLHSNRMNGVIDGDIKE